MNFMHIKFVFEKNKFCCTLRGQHFTSESVPQERFFGHFLAKFLTLFEKAAGRSESVVAGHTPNSRGINNYIERVSHNNIGRLGLSIIFWRKKGNFFLDLIFFSFFHPKFSCGRTRIFFKKKSKILAGFTTEFFFIWKWEIWYFQYV